MSVRKWSIDTLRNTQARCINFDFKNQHVILSFNFTTVRRNHDETPARLRQHRAATHAYLQIFSNTEIPIAHAALGIRIRRDRADFA